MEIGTGRERLIAPDPVQVTLDLPEVLGAGNDFLPRIAPLVETDAAELLEIGHLRNELFLRRSSHQREAGLNVEPPPGRQSGGKRLQRKLLPEIGRGVLLNGNDVSVGFQPDHAGLGADCHGQRRRRAGQARIGKRFARLATGKTEQ